ncbi:Cortistatin [Pteropus alecto]|uniref:Cortistatin n=1 Tax=Pteropus alecto TaxID=9402 RepID=L5KGT6_PTEAL|nr:Cortistatin [Pteropus alecto]
MPPPLCLLLLLLLLLLGATAALPLESGLAGHDSGVSSPCLGRMLARFLAVSLADLAMPVDSPASARPRWYKWTSQAHAVPFVGAAREVSKRQEGPPPQQAPRPEKAPCKNFFWKTFSSCK